MNHTASGLNTILTRLLEIAIDLGRYQDGVASEAAPAQVAPPERREREVPGTGLAAVARRLLKEANARDPYFPGMIAPEPAWLILLDLYIHNAECRKVSITSVSIAARVPSTTALRLIADLVDRGIIEKTPDPADGRRFYLSLAPHVFADMSRYLAGITGIDALVGQADAEDLRRRIS